MKEHLLINQKLKSLSGKSIIRFVQCVRPGCIVKTFLIDRHPVSLEPKSIRFLFFPSLAVSSCTSTALIRTVARKFWMRGLCMSLGGIYILKFEKKLHRFTVLHNSIWGSWIFGWVAESPKAARDDINGVNYWCKFRTHVLWSTLFKPAHIHTSITPKCFHILLHNHSHHLSYLHLL